MDKPLLGLVRFYYSVLPPDYYQIPHLHAFHQLDVVLEGRREIALEDEPPVIDQAGDAWLIPPLVRHAYTSSSGYRHMLFLFHLAPRFWPHFGSGSVKFRISPLLLEEIERTGKRSTRDALLSREQVAAAASLCLVECLDRQTGEERPSDTLDEFRYSLWPLLNNMEDEPYSEWTVERMAAECHLSPGHFSYCFLRVTGRSPHRYVLETRMRAVSSELLVTPERPIKEIADRAGYSTVQSFARAFKRVFKVAPAAYRRLPREDGARPPI